MAWPVRATAPNGAPRWFPETSHTLAYNFRLFWEQNGGLPLFGYPISEVFVEDNRPVQYFERARLEWHGNLGVVQLGQLGRWAIQSRAAEPAGPPPDGHSQSDRDYFAATGHSLSGGFRQFWHAHGGLPIFGLPISEEFSAASSPDGRLYTVQYFERARFEWHPELPPNARVQLGQLGREYLEATQAAPPAALARTDDASQAWDGVRPTHIRIPRVGVDADVVESGFSLRGWDVPRYTAAHYWPVAGFPATAGNIVIAGHAGYKDTIFNHLPDTALGDEITLQTGQTERHYRVTDIWTVGPDDVWVMAPLPSETLTLITCVPIGVYTHRLIVRAVPFSNSL